MSQASELFVINPSKKEKQSKAEQITFENKHLYDQMTFGKIQQRWVKTTDGKDMLYWIVLPAHFDENKNIPRCFSVREGHKVLCHNSGAIDGICKLWRQTDMS